MSAPLVATLTAALPFLTIKFETTSFAPPGAILEAVRPSRIT